MSFALEKPIQKYFNYPNWDKHQADAFYLSI